MSGTAVKPAGKETVSVELLRAIVRIDVKVSASNTTLEAVQLRNVATVAPFFRTQEETSLPRAASEMITTTANTSGSLITGNAVNGGLYTTETSLDVSDNHILLSQATCLLVSVKSTNIHTEGNSANTWYRVNLNIDGYGMQYLKRNNAYRVVITDVNTAGSNTPDGAYNDKATLIDAVTVPTGWKASGVVTPPDVTIQ